MSEYTGSTVTREHETREIYRCQCGTTYGDERMAAFCCATGHICMDCGVETGERHRVTCNACQAKAEREAWEKYEVVAWNGEPLADAFGDRFYFSDEEVDELLAEHPDTMLVMCEPMKGWAIDLNEHLYDILPEDGEADPPKEVTEALAIVNAWITGTTHSWWPTNKRPRLHGTPTTKDQP